jgi:hypothetical protein
MAGDIVDRLHVAASAFEAGPDSWHDTDAILMREAIAEIERLRAERKQAIAKAFADGFDSAIGCDPGGYTYSEAEAAGLEYAEREVQRGE